MSIVIFKSPTDDEDGVRLASLRGYVKSLDFAKFGVVQQSRAHPHTAGEIQLAP